MAYRRTYLHGISEDNFGAIIKRIAHRERAAQIALADAVNKAAREVINLSVDEWNAWNATPTGYIKPHIVMQRGAKPENAEAVIWARKRDTRLNNYRYRVMPKRKGVYVNVNRGSSGDVIRNAFVIRAKSDGKPLILERLERYKKGEARNFKQEGEKPKFKALYGPSPNQHFYDSRRRVQPQAMSAAKKQFLKAMGR